MTEMTYIGRRWSDKQGKTYHVWLPVDGTEKWYAKPIVTCPIGSRYAFTYTSDGQVFTGGENRPRFVARGEDERIPTWQLEDRAAATLQEQKRLKADDREAIAEVLAPIRQMMLRADRNRRAAIISVVLAEIAVIA